MAGFRLLPDTMEMVWHGRRYRRRPGSHNRSVRVYWMATTAPRSYLHRDMYEFWNGPIPKGWHVHHKNGDPLDNCPQNLEAVPSGPHAAEHWAQRGLTGYVCQMCGKVFVTKKLAHNLRWCSSACKERYRRSLGIAYVRPRIGHPSFARVCPGCSAAFTSRKPWGRYCSSTCKSRHRRAVLCQTNSL